MGGQSSPKPPTMFPAPTTSRLKCAGVFTLTSTCSTRVCDFQEQHTRAVLEFSLALLRKATLPSAFNAPAMYCRAKLPLRFSLSRRCVNPAPISKEYSIRSRRIDVTVGISRNSCGPTCSLRAFQVKPGAKWWFPKVPMLITLSSPTGCNLPAAHHTTFHMEIPSVTTTTPQLH